MTEQEIFIRERGAADRRTGSGWWAVRPSATGAACAILAAAVIWALVWLFTGSMVRGVEISGIVFPQHGIQSVESRREGTVSYCQVKVGESVYAGDLLAIIPHSGLLEEIRAARAARAPQEELDALYEQYQVQSMVYSPVSGRVVEVVDQGTHMQVGDTLADIASSDPYTNEAEIRAYVPVDTAQSISKGMEVRIYPQYESRALRGYLPGLVSEISGYPITQADIQRDLGRFYSGQDLGENLLEVRVTLLPGAGQGGEETAELDLNTQCSMTVVIDEMTPWEWLRGR